MSNLTSYRIDSTGISLRDVNGRQFRITVAEFETYRDAQVGTARQRYLLAIARVRSLLTAALGAENIDASQIVFSALSDNDFPHDMEIR